MDVREIMGVFAHRRYWVCAWHGTSNWLVGIERKPFLAIALETLLDVHSSYGDAQQIVEREPR